MSAPTSQDIVFTDTEKADLLNDYFASIFTINDQQSNLPDYRPLTGASVSSIVLSEDEIQQIIQTLVTNKAVGEDIISHYVLKTQRRP